jgi:transcriptional regulator with XRE-family HTH domain
MLSRMHAGNLPIRAAAARCGIHYRSWSDWENGRKPRDKEDVAEKISEGLGVDLRWLLFGGPLARSEENRDRWERVFAVAGIANTSYVAPVIPLTRMNTGRPAGIWPPTRAGAPRPHVGFATAA